MIPNSRARFCTRIIKLQPFAAYCAGLGEACAYIGLRADEPLRTGATGMYDAAGIETRYPLREWGWGINEVMEYLDSKGVKIPPRTDCALCFFQRLGEWWKLWRDHPEMYQEGIDLEEQIGHTFRSASRDTWPADLKTLREWFEEGKVPKHANQLEIDATPGQCRVCSL